MYDLTPFLDQLVQFVDQLVPNDQKLFIVLLSRETTLSNVSTLCPFCRSFYAHITWHVHCIEVHWWFAFEENVECCQCAPTVSALCALVFANLVVLVYNLKFLLEYTFCKPPPMSFNSSWEATNLETTKFWTKMAWFGQLQLCVMETRFLQDLWQIRYLDIIQLKSVE